MAPVKTQGVGFDEVIFDIFYIHLTDLIQPHMKLLLTNPIR